MQTLVDNLARKLSATTPVIADKARTNHAAVAAIVSEINGEPHLLLIQRSESPHDPWSGHIAFPGGRIDPPDVDLHATAVRETQEEIGLDLRQARYLGCLDPSPTLTGHILIATFVYTIDSIPTFTLEAAEVADTHWIPVAHITNPSRVAIHEHHGVEYPAVKILEQEHPILWGLTLRICRELFPHPPDN